MRRHGTTRTRLVAALGLTILLGVGALDAGAQDAAGGSFAVTSITCEVDAAAGEPTGAAFAVDGPGGSIAAPQAPEGCAVGPADFEVIPFGDATGEAIPLSTDEAGVAFIDAALPETAGTPHVLVELTTGDSTPFEVAAGQLTVVDATLYVAAGVEPPPPAEEPPPIDVTPVTEEQPAVPTTTGEVAITAVACAVAEGDAAAAAAGTEIAVLPPSAVAVAAAPEATDACAPAPADLAIYPFGDTEAAPLAATVDATGLAFVDELPVTTDTPHLLLDVASGRTAPFEVGDGQLTLLGVTTTAATSAQDSTGTLEVRAYDCTEGVDGLQLTAFPPGNPAGSEAVPNASCAPGAGDFTIQPYSDPAQAEVAFSVDASGVGTTEVPFTHSVPHILAGAYTGTTTPFTIDPGATTVVVALIAAEAPAPIPTAAPTEAPCDPCETPVPTPAPTQAPAPSGGVATLPNTGAGGDAQGGAPSVALLMGAAGLALLGGARAVRRAG